MIINLQNLAYAVVQVAHNFGAASVLGGSAAALWLCAKDHRLQYRLAWLVAVAWAVQALSGASFGAISYYNYGKFPDLKGIAVAALVVKILCAMAGFISAVNYLRKDAELDQLKRHKIWQASFALGATAFSAAAFLRWFS